MLRQRRCSWANEATVRLAGYLYDQPNAPARGTNALRHSGASALLSQWRVQRLSLVTTGEDGESSSTNSLTGEELAGLLDDYLGSQDWRQGGVSGVTDSVARAAAAAQAGADAAEATAEAAGTAAADALAAAMANAGISEADATNLIATWARVGNAAVIPNAKIENHVSFSATLDTSHANFTNGKDGDLILGVDSLTTPTEARLFMYSGGAWQTRITWDLTPSGGGETVTLLATLTTANGTTAQFDAVRAFINGGGAKLRVIGEYPRAFGTITDGVGYIRSEWPIPAGLTIPAASNSDTFFREFADAYSDQTGSAEPLAMHLRPGGTNKVSVANTLPAGYTVRIYGVS